MTAAEWLQSAEASLRAAGVDTPRLDAQLILAHHFNQTRTWILAHLEEVVDDAALQTSLSRRLKREPLAYITGKVEFYGREYRVSPDVLIPRQDTETLVDAVLKCELPTGSCALDVGTGSGCIAITLKSERPDFKVVASDISSDALKVAKANATFHEASIDFLVADGIPTVTHPIDVLVSNPPYIAPDTQLMPEVVHFEPHQALFANDHGYDMYSQLAVQSGQCHIQHVFVEIGQGMEERVTQIFYDGGYDHIKSHRDLSGIIRVLQFESGSPVSEPREPRRPPDFE